MTHMNDLKFKERFALKIQYMAGWVTLPFWSTLLIALMRFVGRYRIQHLREIRRYYKNLKRTVEGPILLCSNHLTKIDSLILNWSLASTWSYMKSFKIFSWNLPERANFYQNYILRTLCYVGSCVPIDRGGSREAVKKSLDKVTYLLRKGHTVTVFPEGGRSRTGRIQEDKFTYGVGRLVNKVSNCHVLCVYLRGHNQKNYSDIPHKGARFYMNMELFKPESAYSGLRATRDVANQIAGRLVRMEQAYFAAAGQ